MSDRFELRVTIESPKTGEVVKAPVITWPDPIVTRTFDAQGEPKVSVVQPDPIQPEWPVYTRKQLHDLGVDDESIDEFVKYKTLVPVS